MTFPPIGVPLSAVALEVQSRDLFDLDFRNASQDVEAGTITTPSGHVGTFGRATTLASVSDAVGTTYTALDGQMAWEMRDWDGDGERESFGLRMGTSDRLAFPATFRWGTGCAGLLEIIETGARSTSGATLFALQADAGSGQGFWIDASAGGYYQFNWNDGSTTRTATLTVGQPVSGDRARFTWEISSTGVITFHQSINEAAPTSATAAALTLPTSPLSSVSYRLNARGSSANPAQGWYRRVRVVAGMLDPVTILERR